MEKVRMPHSGHNLHLCYLVNMAFHDKKSKKYDALVDEPKYKCIQCGRVANLARNLCKPRKLATLKDK